MNENFVERFSRSLSRLPETDVRPGRIPPGFLIATGHDDHVMLVVVRVGDPAATADAILPLITMAESVFVLEEFARTHGLIRKLVDGNSTVIRCGNCGKEIRTRSFHALGHECPHCGQCRHSKEKQAYGVKLKLILYGLASCVLLSSCFEISLGLLLLVAWVPFVIVIWRYYGPFMESPREE